MQVSEKAKKRERALLASPPSPEIPIPSFWQWRLLTECSFFPRKGRNFKAASHCCLATKAACYRATSEGREKARNLRARRVLHIAKVTKIPDLGPKKDSDSLGQRKYFTKTKAGISGHWSRKTLNMFTNLGKLWSNHLKVGARKET